MNHLSSETLARMSEGPHVVGAEDAHVESCPQCAAMLREFVEQRRVLQLLSRSDAAVVEAHWAQVATRLRDEGLLRRSQHRLRRRVRVAAWVLAASIAGIAIGKWSDRIVTRDHGMAPATADPVSELRDAEARYRAAVTRYARENPVRSENSMSQLAALQAIVLTTGQALRQAPSDPLINGYLIAATSQRDELLRTTARWTESTRRRRRWF